MAALTGTGGAEQQMVNIGQEAVLAAQRFVFDFSETIKTLRSKYSFPTLDDDKIAAPR